jgi:exosortase
LRIVAPVYPCARIARKELLFSGTHRRHAARSSSGWEFMSATPQNPVTSPSHRWWQSLLMLTPLLAAIGWLYWDTLLRLPEVWSRDPDYSHGYLVPLIALVLAARQWRRYGAPLETCVDGRDMQVGLSRIALGMVGHGVCWFSPDFLVLDVLSLLCSISGVAIVLGGRQRYRAFAFPIWFLIFMSPLPVVLYRWLALMLQQTSAIVAAGALDVLGVPAVRVGYCVHLPGSVMEVGAACSGLRGVLGILATALAIGHVVDGTRVFRWALVLIAVPVAVLANSVRVVLTGVIIYCVGSAWSQGVWHDLEGLITSGLAMAMMLAAAWLLSRATRGRPSGDPAMGDSATSTATTERVPDALGLPTHG